MKHPELTTVALLIMGLAIAAGWSLVVVLQFIAAQCGWWGLLLPGLCFALAIFGREILRWWRRRRIVRASLRTDLDLQHWLREIRRAPLIEPREAARLRPIIYRDCRDRLEPNGKSKHQKNKLP